MDLLQRDDRTAFFNGIIRIEDHEAEGLELHRTTAHQLAHLDRLSAALGVRGRCNSGMQMALRTDATQLELALTLHPGARKTFVLTASIDGVIHHPICETDLPDGPITVTVPLAAADAPRRSHEVRILFPPSRPVWLRQAVLVDATTAEPLPPKSRRLLCLGDSITQGMEALSPLAPYPTALAAAYDAELLNQGIGGHVFDAAFIDETLPFTPDLVTIAYGTNDWGRGLTAGAIQAEATACLTRIATLWPRARVVLLTPFWRACQADTKAGGTLADIRAAIAAAPAGDIAARCTVLDGLTLIPNEARYFSDGTHPNDLGFGCCAAALINRLLLMRA